MIYALLGLSLLFVIIGVIITKENAKYLLSGYNTMSDTEREKVDIVKYITLFKRFHIFLGVSLLVVGGLLYYIIDSITTVIFMTIYPLLAYTYFMWTARRYMPVSGTVYKASLITVFLAAILVVFMFVKGLQENKLIFDNEKIELVGWYGETVKYSEVSTLELVNELPAIESKSNGFAIGSVRKGYFRTSQGEKIKLIINADKKPIIQIIKKDGSKIYYASGTLANEEIYKGITEKISELESVN